MGRTEDRDDSEPMTSAGHGQPPTPSESSTITALRHRHLHALHGIVDAYRRADDSGDRTQRSLPATADPVALVDGALTAFTSAVDLNLERLTDGEVFLHLCVLLRSACVGDAVPEDGPGGLLELFADADRPTADERRCVLDAFGSLDERDRVVLWFAATEGALPSRLATLLASADPDAAATSAHLARSRLRRGYARRRVAAPDWPVACAALAEQLVRLAGGSAPQQLDTADRAHLRGCARCTHLADELAALPTQLAVEAAALQGRGPASAQGERTASTPSIASGKVDTPESTPIVISTTPLLGGPEPAPVTHTEMIHPTMIDDEAAEPARRRTGTIVGLAAIFFGVAVALTVWLSIERPSSSPATPGDTITVPRSAASTLPTAGAGIGVASSTAAPTSTVTTTVPPTEPPTTPAVTGSKRPAGPASSPAWSPPRTAGPGQAAPPSNAATISGTTAPPHTAPPTTAAAAPNPSTSIGTPPTP